MTLGWSSGKRRRHLRKNYSKGATGRHRPKLMRHFTVTEIRERRDAMEEGALEMLLAKSRLLRYQSGPIEQIFERDEPSQIEKGLWKEWDRQVEVWSANRPESDVDDDVRLWTKALARFDHKRKSANDEETKKVNLAVSIEILRRVLDALRDTIDVLDFPADPNVDDAAKLMDIARGVTQLAIEREQESDAGADRIERIQGFWDEKFVRDNEEIEIEQAMAMNVSKAAAQVIIQAAEFTADPTADAPLFLNDDSPEVERAFRALVQLAKRAADTVEATARPIAEVPTLVAQVNELEEYPNLGALDLVISRANQAENAAFREARKWKVGGRERDGALVQTIRPPER